MAPAKCLGDQRKELGHPKFDGDALGEAGVHGAPNDNRQGARHNSARSTSSSVRTMTGSDDGELLELEVGDIAGGGGCVGHAPDGRVVFVRHAVPGERVVARVTSTTSSFMRADAVDVIRASPDRVPPPCPFTGPGRCGGCDFQHIALGAQRRTQSFADRRATPSGGRHHTRRGRRTRAIRRKRVGLAHQGPARGRSVGTCRISTAPLAPTRAGRPLPHRLRRGDARQARSRPAGPASRNSRSSWRRTPVNR